jgi:hypothetical protein
MAKQQRENPIIKPWRRVFPRLALASVLRSFALASAAQRKGLLVSPGEISQAGGRAGIS